MSAPEDNPADDVQPTREEWDAFEAEVKAQNSDRCPGRLKCHGPSGWCNECGDVDLICDDPKCEAHLRGDERKNLLDQATRRLMTAEQEYKSACKEEEEARRTYARWITGNGYMVGREPCKTSS